MQHTISHHTRFLLFRNETAKMLSLSVLFSVLLIVFRVLVTGNLTFVFLVWNLFLAFIPYALTAWLMQKPAWIEHRFRFTVVFIAWILFIPNTFYLLTDLFHLGAHRGVPLWFDLLLIVSFAWNGLLLGIISVREMEKVIQVYIPGKTELLFVCPVMWLNALGVYIGRYLRFNSWDILTNPFELAGDIAALLLHPLRYYNAWGMIGGFSVFITLVYLTIKRMGRYNV